MKKIVILILLIFSINIGLAQSSTESLIYKIQNIHSMSANFSQTLIDGQNNSNITSQGSMFLEKPSFFNWTTTSPNNQEIISNGKSLWFYDADLEQLVIKNLSNDIAQAPYLILLSKNSENLDTLFKVKANKDNSYTLKPKDNDSIINNIKIKFDDNDNLRSLDISTSLHQYTKIEFSNVETNIEISKDKFKFSAPKGTDIINETKN
ncbi:outer membrane lipoprotein chaperone LolA [Pseudofrancisella aestuarii]|uniref:Outer-membrane lipoprotein carrier protein n=1 Tax=Pseudofrancisella aestuarii TaxID=2670347 RepID=A0ABV9TE58_9GAMM|nr:outer membrane lipoprotein chaperone LolA [Pseudofrancisella aestuarii]